MPQWGERSKDRQERVIGCAKRRVAAFALLTLIPAACGIGGTEAGSETVSPTVDQESTTTEVDQTTSTAESTTTDETEEPTTTEAPSTTEEPTTTVAPTTAAPTTAAPTTAAPTTAAPTTAAPTTAAPTTAAPTTAAPTTAAPTTAAPTTAAPISGSALYANNCASCHGGSGEGVSAPSLQGVAGRLSTGQMIGIVNNGGGGMPAFAGKLSAAQIEAVVAHARGL